MMYIVTETMYWVFLYRISLFSFFFLLEVGEEKKMQLYYEFSYKKKVQTHDARVLHKVLHTLKLKCISALLSPLGLSRLVWMAQVLHFTFCFCGWLYSCTLKVRITGIPKIDTHSPLLSLFIQKEQKVSLLKRMHLQFPRKITETFIVLHR